ncbi:MAG: hypothetical protein ACLGGV_09595 [Bacteroidia bacterium]
MKKSLSLFVGVFIANIILAQGFKSSFIDPNISSGYITWESIPDARYEVHVYSKDEQGNEIPIEVIQTEKNFTKLNLNISIPDVGSGVFFKTIAISKETGSIIDIGIEIEQIANEPSYINTCSKNCNGINYAWSLQWWQKPDYYGNIYPERPGKLLLRNAYDYYDKDGLGTPYFRAMSSDQYAYWREFEIKKYHKLEEYMIIGPEYVTRQDCILDATGVILEGDVFFVEKKTEQWTYMQTNYTDDFNNNQMCAKETPIGYWIDLYNTKSKQTDWYEEPLNGEPTDLACISAKVCGKGGGTTGGGDEPDPTDWDCTPVFIYENGVWVKTVLDCFTDFNDGDPFNSNGGNTGGDKKIKRFEFQKLDDPTANKTTIQGSEISNSMIKNLEVGLYRMTIIYQDHKAFPIVFEHLNQSDNNYTNNYATLDITPNPIKESINMMLSSTKNTEAIINIYTLDGTIIYSEQVALSKNRKTTKSVNVANTEVIYNQWRVVVNFPDATSIHKTVTR